MKNLSLHALILGWIAIAMFYGRLIFTNASTTSTTTTAAGHGSTATCQEEGDTKQQSLSIFDDITESDLHQLANFFQFSYNEPTDEKFTYPVEGVVYGNNRRIIFPLIISHRGYRIKTLFLYDTSAPFSYISESTLKALKIEELVLNSMNIALQGDLVTVHPSLSTFPHINIVGQEFFRGLKALVAIDYYKLKAKIFLLSNAQEELETKSTSPPTTSGSHHS